MRFPSAEEWQAIAGVATFCAALVAVWATFKAPERAAQFAETLRLQSAEEEQSKRLKLWVFTTLMQYRSAIANINAVSALNVIDVVFHDDRDVRDAWRLFLTCANTKPLNSAMLIDRYNAILEKMSRNLNLLTSITVFDIQNSYYPEGLGTLDAAAHAEAIDKLERFSAKSARPA
jgi:hypothetical protein